MDCFASLAMTVFQSNIFRTHLPLSAKCGETRGALAV
jgi:hypothetical protein